MTELEQAIVQNVNVWLYGWKSLAGYFDISKRTLQRWHRRLPIPWQKQGPRKNHSVRIHIKVADAYYSILTEDLLKK